MEADRRCRTCLNWITERVSIYESGARIATFQSRDGHGLCPVLNQETAQDFGCTSYKEGGDGGSWLTRKSGKPSDYWTMIPCPNCTGAGSSNSRACRRCSGTGSVRRYDDGYIADETWDHPDEKARKAALRMVPKVDPNTELRPLPSAQGGAMGSGSDDAGQ